MQKEKPNKKIATELSKFDKKTIFQLIDAGIIKISPLQITKNVFEKEQLEKIQDLIDLNLVEIVPSRFDSTNSYEDCLTLLKFDIKELEKTIQSVINCSDTEEAWGKISNQGRELDQLIFLMKKIRKKIYNRVTELHGLFGVEDSEEDTKQD